MTRKFNKAFAITLLLQGAAVAFAQADDVKVKNETSSQNSDQRYRDNMYGDDLNTRRMDDRDVGQGTASGVTTTGNTQVSTTEVKTEDKGEERKNRGFNVGVIGNYTIANPSEIRGGSAARAGTAKDPVGGGLLLQAPLGMAASLGAEVQYLTRGGNAGLDNFQMLHVPVIARVYPFRILSLGLGGYYSRVLSSGGAGRVPSPALQFSDNDYGAVGVAGFDIPITDVVGLIAEGRLTQSIASKVGDADTWNDRNLQGVAGIRVNLSEL